MRQMATLTFKIDKDHAEDMALQGCAATVGFLTEVGFFYLRCMVFRSQFPGQHH